MTDDDGAGGGSPPGFRVVSVNQVVAWNLARYRKKAGYTQDELGEMIGIKGSAVSDAERSWDSGRTREFDAQLLSDIALALDIPVVALLLPPEVDEALEVRHGNGNVAVDLYMEYAVVPNPQDGQPAAEYYRDRFTRAVHRHLQPEAAEVAVQWWMRPLEGEDLPVLADRFRDYQRAAAEQAAEWKRHADAIEAQLRGRP